MINSDAYSYIDILDKAADASALRNEAISNNIANVDTPGYKREDVDFESVLTRELGHSKYITLDSKVKNLDMDDLNAKVYKERTGASYRLDENNVDIEQESAAMAKNQITYAGLTDSISQELSRLKAVMSS